MQVDFQSTYFLMISLIVHDADAKQPRFHIYINFFFLK